MLDKITSTQVALLVTSNIIGVTFLIMPRLLAEAAGRDGWISILISGLLVLFFNMIAVLLGWRFPGKSIVAYNYQILGRYPGLIFNFLLIAFFTLVAAFALRAFGDITKVFLLQKTPLEVIMISMLFVAAYLLNHGVNSLARMAQVLFPLLVFPLLLVLVLGQQGTDFGELLPLMEHGIMPVARGVLVGWRIYAGFGITSLLLPQMLRPRQALLASSVGIALPIFFYLASFATALALFGEKDLTNLVYPIMDLAREIEFPGAFLERMEILILALWIFTSFSTIAISGFMGIWAAGQTLGLKEFRGLVALWLPLIYLLAILPQNYSQLALMGSIVGDSSLALSLMVLLLWWLALLRRKGGAAGA